LYLLLVLILIGGAAGGYWLYQTLFSPNVRIKAGTPPFLYIPTGSHFEDVTAILERNKLLKNISSFERVAGWKHYEEKVRPGRYRIREGMSNIELVGLLRSGKQEPVMVTFQNIRTRKEFAGKISKLLEADSISLLKLMNDKEFLMQYGVDPANSFVLIIPNTYEFYWNTSAKDFFRRMEKEKEKFWNAKRKEKCRAEGLTISQVVTLASIVEKESVKDSEKPAIAGVYMNRLKKGWPLQADPTVIFALNDYTIRRVLNCHLTVDSPYNTYLHTGIPPGPICVPSISSIDAVLNYQHHNYYYFCAKDDLSGYHVFATTLQEHSRNAKKYQAAIKKQGIH
jgi:UPF0755 protein